MALIRDESKDVIEAGALRVTTASGFGAGVVVLVTTINPVFEAIFGEQQVTPGVKAAIVIAAIVSWAFIAAVDIAARSYATSQQRLATATHAPQIAAAPAGMTVKKTRGTDVPGFFVAAIRYDRAKPGSADFLLVKQGEAPEWVPGSELTLS